LAAFSVSWSCAKSVGHLGRGISPSKGRYIHTEQYKHRMNVHRHPYLEWDSNPRSQLSSERRCIRPRGHCDRRLVGAIMWLDPAKREHRREGSLFRNSIRESAVYAEVKIQYNWQWLAFTISQSATRRPFCKLKHRKWTTLQAPETNLVFMRKQNFTSPVFFMSSSENVYVTVKYIHVLHDKGKFISVLH
jgi:hypothetical protein